MAEAVGVAAVALAVVLLSLLLVLVLVAAVGERLGILKYALRLDCVVSKICHLMDAVHCVNHLGS